MRITTKDAKTAHPGRNGDHRPGNGESDSVSSKSRTNGLLTSAYAVRDQNAGLRIYLAQAAQTPLITPEEEVRLYHQMKGDDTVASEDAREQMILANLRLVVKIAMDYDLYGLPLLDLINEGNMGLMRAVERFDPTKGAKLSTYAAWWIKQGIKRAIGNQVREIRLPMHILQSLARIKKKIRESEFEENPSLDLAELAQEEGIDIDRLMDLLERRPPISLDIPLDPFSPDGGTVADIVADPDSLRPDDEVEGYMSREIVLELVGTLCPREQAIIRRRFGLDGGETETLEAIGEDWGVTRERIRQLENQALNKLRRRGAVRLGRRLPPPEPPRRKRAKMPQVHAEEE